MAKYDVTPELAEIIKSTRLRNRVPAKSVAKHIEKSPSYISKLEKGEIKTIQESELTAIFRYIFGNEKDFQDFLTTTLDEILNSIGLKYSDAEISEQLWFYNYDTVLRLIPIPEEMADDLRNRINNQFFSIDDLCTKINANTDISPEVTNTDLYPFNEWQGYVENHQVKFHFIKMKVDLSEIQDILTKKRDSANYVTLLAIVYYLLKAEKNITTTGDHPDIMREANNYLKENKFYTIAEKNKISKQAQSEAEFNNLFSSFDKDNIELINEILKIIQVMSDLDLVRTNKYLESFLKNLKWDHSFIMSLLNISFYDMEDYSFSVKKQLLSDINDIVTKYKTLSASEKAFEVYD